MKRMTQNRLVEGLIGLAGVPLIIGLITFLLSTGSITVDNYAANEYCGGEEVCWLEVYNVTFNEDVFLYPMEEEYILNAEPSDEVKDVRIYRNWGSGWRQINMDTPCRGSWCGCYWCTTSNTAKYVIAFRANRTYSLRYEVDKSVESTVRWSINPKGEWKPSKDKDKIKLKEEPIIVYYNKTVDNPYYTYQCYDAQYTNGTQVQCGDELCPIDWGCNITFHHNYSIVTKNKTIGYLQRLEIQGEIFNVTENQQYCEKQGDTITCDSTLDGNADGICQSGESCTIYQTKTADYEATDHYKDKYEKEMKHYNVTEDKFTAVTIN